MKNYYKPGCWNTICQLCGGKFKSDEVRKRWDGLIVCKNDWEERHILDFLRAPPERGNSVPFTAPEPADVFIEIASIYNKQGLAGLSMAGVAIAGYVAPL